MNKKPILMLGLTLALAVALTLLKVPVASSQGTTLSVAYVDGELPTADPGSPLWRQASSIEVPLSAQNVTRPILPQASVRSLSARALHNGSQVAFLLEWADETENAETIRVQDFTDSVAVQFPLAEGQPFFCMGQQGGNVNIWHWKADWQAGIAARQAMDGPYPDMMVDYYPFAEGEAPALEDYTDASYAPAFAVGNLMAGPHESPVEDLIAGGFATLTAYPAEAQTVQGHGVWSDGRWRVVFSRSLTAREVDQVSFAPGTVYSVAFAVWDGANSERNGKKSTSQWVSLQFEREARPAAPPEAADAPARPQAALLMGVLTVALPVLTLLLAAGIAAVMYYLSRATGRNGS